MPHRRRARQVSEGEAADVAMVSPEQNDELQN
jgi:hypothetical protein